MTKVELKTESNDSTKSINSKKYPAPSPIKHTDIGNSHQGDRRGTLKMSIIPLNNKTFSKSI